MKTTNWSTFSARAIKAFSNKRKTTNYKSVGIGKHRFQENSDIGRNPITLTYVCGLIGNRRAVRIPIAPNAVVDCCAYIQGATVSLKRAANISEGRLEKTR